MKPLIGVVTYHQLMPETGWLYDVSYVNNASVVEEAGGIPVLIPTGISQDSLRGLYERLDGLLLPGGGDINPQHYGADEHPTVSLVSDERDLVELSLMRWAAEDDRPVLGICRGVQLMNVALGGTLIQDVPSQAETDIAHSQPFSEARSKRIHDVTITPGTRLAGIVGQQRLTVNSIHHQAIHTLAHSFKASAHAPDGIVEGIEARDKRFIIGVQWHPEDMRDEAPIQRLFTSFVEAASENIRR